MLSLSVDNQDIRKRNAVSREPADPVQEIIDAWGIVPEVFMETLPELGSSVLVRSLDCREARSLTGAESEFVFLLEMYGQSVEKQGCCRRFIEFIGVDVALGRDGRESGQVDAGIGRLGSFSGGWSQYRDHTNHCKWHCAVQSWGVIFTGWVI